MTSLEKKYTETVWVECDECDGKGEALYEVGVRDFEHGGYLEDRLLPCHVCDGKGQLEAEIDEEEMQITVFLENAGSIH
jgi:DnaJ-class molecular chaperone